MTTKIPQYIKTATWNVEYSTSTRVLSPILKQLLDDDVVLLAMQEAYGSDIAAMLKVAGLNFYQAGEGLVAWDPKVFTQIGKGELISLSKTTYFTTKGHEVETTMPTVILCDMWGRTIKAGCYHTPPNVMGGAMKAPVRRWAVIKNVAVTWTDVANTAQTRAVWLAGDDNIDESKISGAQWAFWLKMGGGLTELQAPSPTHGDAKKGSRIDSMRVKGLKPATVGSVRPGGGDHRIHVRLLRWV